MTTTSDLERTDAVRPGRGPLRVARSLAASAGCLLAAAGAHRAAGGVVPTEVVLALVAGAAAVTWVLAARRLTRGQLTGLVLLAQVVVHTACAADGMTMTPVMLAVHVLATALTVAALDRGEALAWRLTQRLVLRPLGVLGRPIVPTHRTVSRVVDEPGSHARSRETTRPVRGPPIGV